MSKGISLIIVRTEIKAVLYALINKNFNVIYRNDKRRKNEEHKKVCWSIVKYCIFSMQYRDM